jgi:uncharacterized RDD family membrane protein YckC
VGAVEWSTLGDFSACGGAAAPGAAPDPEAPPSEAPLGSRWARLGAAIVDGLLMIPAMVPFISMMVRNGEEARDAFMTASRDHDWSAVKALPGFTTAAVVGGSLLLVLMVIQAVLLTLRGQTVGKILCGIRIVRFPSGSRVGFVRVWLVRSLVTGLLGKVPYVGSIFALVDILFIFSPNKRCLHDLLAGTKVVTARSS